MYKEILNNFLDEYVSESKTPSAAAIGHFLMRLETTKNTDEIKEIMHKAALEDQPDREEEIAKEVAMFKAFTSCEQVIKAMRGKYDVLSRPFLLAKAVELEYEVVPEVVRRLKTNLQDTFIEAAAMFLAKTNINVSEELIAYFDEVKNPFAKSIILLVLGFKADEKHIPWMIEKYHEMKKTYRSEAFHEGAYYGLTEMYERFYTK